ncbi:DNA-binding transcriptional regulator, ArsR family [Propionibacterium cyclohexanicum]|uniref:DNA-binding transcriptional regulator, ArsR family n=1 Tax=Propionibacterium cyclohexanicum TaxID=64702 RepID=A0A1H9TPJ7_9ACTN|nr:metalloregulator ArsR/SmtB family transcription factor [Propionibacterium cyclohexanicum]SER98988.1 DNA-binding transcriptional regulator, ArsR family [Propionibacterium cyclohexanicum]
MADLQEVLRAVADPARRRVLELLRSGGASAGELSRATGLSPSALSYHLVKLKEAGLVREDKQGRFVFYHLNLTVLEDAAVWFAGFAGRGGDGHE